MMLIDTEVAALAAGVTARTIRNWVAGGLLVNHGTARKIRVELIEVERVAVQIEGVSARV